MTYFLPDNANRLGVGNKISTHTINNNTFVWNLFVQPVGKISEAYVGLAEAVTGSGATLAFRSQARVDLIAALAEEVLAASRLLNKALSEDFTGNKVHMNELKVLPLNVPDAPDGTAGFVISGNPLYLLATAYYLALMSMRAGVSLKTLEQPPVVLAR